MRVLFFIAVALALTGCGAGYHDALRSAIAGTRTACELGERMIVEREGTSLSEDERDLARIRAGCDAAYAALEELTKAK